MGLGTSWSESPWNSKDDGLALLAQFWQVNLISRRALEKINTWDSVSNLQVQLDTVMHSTVNSYDPITAGLVQYSKYAE